MSREINELEKEIAETRADLDEALDMLQAKMSPSALLGQAFNHFHNSPTMSASMGPMYAHRPFTALAMTAGLNWYLSRRAAKQEQENDREWQAYHDERPRRRMRKLASRARERVKAGAERISGRVSEMKEHLAESASHATDNTHHMTDAAKERMHSMADGTRTRLHGMADSGSRRLHGAVEDSRERSRRMKDRTRERMRTGKQRASSFLEKQPLLAGAICALVGAVIAGSIPATSPERRAARPLASKAKRLKTKAKEKLVEGVERGTSMAAEALENATTKIEDAIAPSSPSVH